MPTPSDPGSREPQKSNTIAILQPIDASDIRLIAADISSGMLTCAIVCLDGLHVADHRLALEPVLAACIDRHLVTAPTGSVLVIGPDLEVRARRCLPKIDRSNLADSPFDEAFKEPPKHQYQERLGQSTSQALQYLFPDKSAAEISVLLADLQNKSIWRGHRRQQDQQCLQELGEDW